LLFILKYPNAPNSGEVELVSLNIPSTGVSETSKLLTLLLVQLALVELKLNEITTPFGLAGSAIIFI